MSDTGEATTTARDQETQDNQTAATEQQAQPDATATTEDSPEINTPSVAGQEAPQNQTATGPQSENVPTAGSEQGAEGHGAATDSEPKPDVSDQDYQQLLP